MQLATYFFDGEYKEPDESLETTEKKKFKGTNQMKSLPDPGKESKTIKTTIYQLEVSNKFLGSNKNKKISSCFDLAKIL